MTHTKATRGLWIVAVIALGALSVVVLPAAPAQGQARNVDDACPPGQVPEDGFTDTGANGSLQETAVDCIAGYRITQGTTATTYGTDSSTLRMQMASFIARLLGADNRPTIRPTRLPTWDGTNRFPCDVETNNVHIANINRLAVATPSAIVRGGPGGKPPNCYAPTEPVKRDQMASFIARALEFAGVPVPDNAGDRFPDVPQGNVHRANINGLAALGVVQGFTGGQYQPGSPVTRGQMAFFLTRALDLLVEAGQVVPPFGGPNLLDITATDGDQSGNLSQGDQFRFDFAAAIVASSSVSFQDNEGDSTRVDSAEAADANNDGISTGTFTIATQSATATQSASLLVTVGADVDVTRGTSTTADGLIDGTLTITDATGIADAQSGKPWVPGVEPAADITVVFSQITLSDGKTNGPDLTGVTFVAPSGQEQISGCRRATFTFDENIATPSATERYAAGFQLIERDGTVVRGDEGGLGACFQTDPERPADTQNAVTVAFTSLDQPNIVRAVVEEATLTDQASPAVPNPLTSIGVTNEGNTDATPNLVSATVTGSNQVRFLFDRDVTVATAGAFALYTVGAQRQTGTSASVDPANARQVIVTYGGSLANVVLAAVAGATPSGLTAPPNGPAVNSTGGTPRGNEDDTVPIGRVQSSP